MKFCYLLESTELGGGPRVVLDQARALKKRGHEASIRALKGEIGWYPYDINIEYVDRLDRPFRPADLPDVVICTYWTTVAAGVHISAPLTMHLCQGYEGDIPELKENHPAIRSAYQEPIPKITVGPWLSERLQEVFGRDRFPVHAVGQIVDTQLFTPRRFYLKNWLPNPVRRYMPINILVIGDFMISCKGIPDALRAVARLRQMFNNIRLIRASLHPQGDDEKRITPVDEACVRLPPKQMAAVYHKADLLFAPSLAAEGFGLPAAEAMACGVPTVLTEIPSFLNFDKTRDFACFVAPHSPDAIAECAASIINNRRLYKQLERRGPEVIQNRFDSEKVVENIEKTVENYLSK